ncbi:MAG: hypothetical protein H5T33_00845 [Candidatus Methanosuratus sp.]|nr:hypothetical protein [Candidatus Methanosuratincola sp.]
MQLREEIQQKVASSVSAAASHAHALASALGSHADAGASPRSEAEPGADDTHAGPQEVRGGSSQPSPRAGIRPAYTSAIRCRLEIQYALLLIQKGLSVQTGVAHAPKGRTVERLASDLRDDLNGALSMIQSGSFEGAGAMLMSSDAKVAQIISKIRAEIKRSHKG